jgi:hypothetical protein
VLWVRNDFISESNASFKIVQDPAPAKTIILRLVKEWANRAVDEFPGVSLRRYSVSVTSDKNLNV